MTCDVIGFGATSVDFVYRLPACPQLSGPNAKMRIRSHFVSCGGQVATALGVVATTVFLRVMGLAVALLGVVGLVKALITMGVVPPLTVW